MAAKTRKSTNKAAPNSVEPSTETIVSSVESKAKKAAPTTFSIATIQDPLGVAISRLSLLRASKDIIEQVGEWIEKLGKDKREENLREPNIRFQLFANHVVSLLRTAHLNWEFVSRRVGTYSSADLEQAARLLIAAELLHRWRERSPTPSPSTDADSHATAQKKEERTWEDVIEERGWSVVADAIASLQEAEERLVKRGAAALIWLPDVQAAFLTDTDDGSFEDAFDDVRRRLDIANNYPELFAKVHLDSDQIAEYEALLLDADMFYKGRESQSSSSKQLTFQRDLAFTLLLKAVEVLQTVLGAAFEDQPFVLEQIEGRYWKRLHKISRPRRKRKAKPTTPEP